MILMRIAITAAAAFLVALGEPHGSGAAVPAHIPVKPQFGEQLVVCLGCGDVIGAGTVVQLDPSGKVLGTLQLPGTPYGLTAHDLDLIAAIPSGRPGKVLVIDRKGGVKSLVDDGQTLPHPIAVAADPVSGDIVVADNLSDVLLLLPAGQAAKASPVLRIKGFEGQLQNMSVAVARDNSLLFGSDAPAGIFRIAARKQAALGMPLLPGDGAVAADPSSKRWLAALRDELRVFEGERELLKLPYPAGMSMSHSTAAFGADGTLVIALRGAQAGFEIFQVDLNAKTFRSLFTWNQSRVVSLAVGWRMSWEKGK